MKREYAEERRKRRLQTKEKKADERRKRRPVRERDDRYETGREA